MSATNKVLSALPDGLRRWLRDLATDHLDLGKRTFYGFYGEDAYLQGYFSEHDRALGLVKPHPTLLATRQLLPGYYVDVGAYHARLFSNSYRFYQRGWRGINIDAAPGSMKSFNKLRPKDINIEAAISDDEEEIQFFYWETPFAVNSFSAEFAAEMAQRFGREPNIINLQTRRLSSILDQHLPVGQPINFMSIDVEGFDLRVLRSNTWNKYRPELVLVESHILKSEGLLSSKIVQFMQSVEYEWCAWLPPTVVFRDTRKRDYRFSFKE